MSARAATPRRRGLTLVEIVLATALLSLLMVALFSLLDGSLSLWQRAETRRSLTEASSGVLELFAGDVRGLEPGADGDVLVDWFVHDLDGDGVGDRALPRLRAVRQASAAEVARSTAAWEDPPVGPELVEVCWAALPATGAGEARMESVLWRGERLLSEDQRLSFFDPGFFDGRGKPRGGELEEVTGGVLWFAPVLATQTSIVYDGWRVGEGLEDAAGSWDAWRAGRTDPQVHPWNEPGAGMPRVDDRPALPRRVLLELELERATDRLRRTRTTDHVQAGDIAIPVEDPDRLPTDSGAHVLIAGEWMRLRTVVGDRITVLRAQRGTAPRPIPAGAMVHWGIPSRREVAVRLYRDDWKL